MEYLLTLMVLLLCYTIYAIMPTYYFKWKQLLRPRKKRKDKVLFLTFDDGPHLEYTEKLLDVLEKNKVKASFFTVAKFAQKLPQVMERMENEGHLIAFHSLEHKDAWLKGPQYTDNDFSQANKIYESLEMKIHYFRPPWGRVNICTLSNVKNYGYQMVLWDTMAQDWKKNATAKMISDKLIKRAKSGKIICLHDGRGINESPQQMIQALEQVLPMWIKEGYRFATVEELDESKYVS